MPVAFVLGFTSLGAILNMGDPVFLKLIPLRVYNGIDLFPLMAMPLFILAGDIMNKAGITTRLVALALCLVGHTRCGLAHASIVASILFAGITGSAVAEAAALGTLLVPAMEKEGYSRGFAAALVAAASCIGPIIPPSTVMVIYGSFMGVSISGLFAAGILPGLIMGFALMICVYMAATRSSLRTIEHRANFRELIISAKHAFLPLLMPVIIAGGILGGLFTPTEAAAIGVFYSFILGWLVYRTIKLRDVVELLTNMTRITAVVFIILSTAAIFSWLLAVEQLPQTIADLILSVTDNKYLVLLIINIVLLIVGCFMDQTAALIILAPVLAPLASKIGIHPLHFGVIVCLNLVIGLITPPVGACLFTICSVGKMSLEEVIKPILPLIISLVIVLLLITYIPALSMTIPKLLGLA